MFWGSMCFGFYTMKTQKQSILMHLKLFSLSLSLSPIVSKGLVLTNFAWEEKLDKNQEKEHFMKFYIHL